MKKMFRLSNNLIGVLNVITFILSIPILWAGIWLSRRGLTECERFLDAPLVTLGAFLMAVSLAGIVGSFWRINWLLTAYLVIMFFVILGLFAFTIFAFVVTNKGAGEVVSGRRYKEYKLGDYSNWLQNRVNNKENWKKIKSCLIDTKVCQSLVDDHRIRTASFEEFYQEHLSSVQSGCCKPMSYCNYTYVSPTNWTVNAKSSKKPECTAWSNEQNVLCFNCPSCKAGLLDNIKKDWKKAAIINIIFLVSLVAVYAVGCCAFKNNREDNFLWRRNP